MSTCCSADGNRKMADCARGVRKTLAWLLPSAILILLPKCPVCLAAYVALGTGISLSLPVATAVRWALLLICIVSLLFLIVNRLYRVRTIFRHFHEETEPCGTK